MTLIRCLTIIVTLNSVIFADGPQKTVKRQFPAKLTVLSSKPLDDGRQEVELNLALEKNVEIFANPVGEFPESYAMKTLIVTEDGLPVPAEIIYPKASRSEIVETDGVDKVNIFSGTLKIQIRFTPPSKTNLKVRCKVSGWNTQHGYCLGSATLESAIPEAKVVQ